MWIAMMVSIFLTAVVMLLIFAVMQKMKCRKIMKREEAALRGIVVGIGDRLHATHPGSRWKWICRPAGFAINGGIARIEVIYSSGERQFMDVCLSESRYMALHVMDVIELASLDNAHSSITDYESTVNTADTAGTPVPTAAPMTGSMPYDEESLGKWYNIVLIDSLNALIDDLNANDEVCLHIGHDGKAFIEENSRITVVYDFGEMPDMALWGHITEKLGAAGLFAEVQEENRIFISWA